MNTNFTTGRLYDLCVVGSGPAGIITALEFASLNEDKKILIVEYGPVHGQKKNSLDESIRVSNTVNHYPPSECTNKGFGGTSASWGGRCVMYDEIDFMQRDVIGQDCTWGTDILKDIHRFLPKAAAYFECGEPTFNLNQIPEFKTSRIAEGFKEGAITDSVLERWSMPTRFGKRYASEIERNPQIEMLKGYEVRTFAAPDSEGHVRSVDIQNRADGETITIEAKRFVISAGSQETTRLLLRNKNLFQNLAFVPPALGHYYQGHVSGKIASVVFNGNPQKTDYGFQKTRDQTFVRRRFQFSTEFLKEQNFLNTAMWLDNPLYHDPEHKSGPMSFMYLAMITPLLGKKLAPPAIAESITKGKKTNINKHLFNVIRGLPGSVIKPAMIFYKRYLLKRKLPGVFLYNPSNQYALHFHAEQKPEYTNCMYLAEDLETLHINYALTDQDIDSVIKTHQALDQWLQACGCGKLRYWFAEDKLYDAIRNTSKDGLHQCGTTRIADSPEKGVVDSNLKVFGTANVYVCSSSVFPTSGQANPTFMLGAFAARLSKHLTESE
jgi:choline dehydrogenase-like flavoprotein